MITRFAPSPTGPLHLGHAFSALLAFDMARAANGRFLLRIEDTDTARSRPEWTQQIFDDLHWLGIEWEDTVLHQSNQLAHYAEVIDGLTQRGMTFPCSCSRKDIINALSAPQEGVQLGPDGIVYPGTCRSRLPQSHKPGDAVRLRIQVSLASLNDSPLSFEETGKTKGQQSVSPVYLLNKVGDVVLGRKEIGTAAYHLASVVDDAQQGITHIIRGEDLFEATSIHTLLQRTLGYTTPIYHHHRLIRDEQGKRLAKRDDARAIALFREQGATPQDIRKMVGL